MHNIKVRKQTTKAQPHTLKSRSKQREKKQFCFQTWKWNKWKWHNNGQRDSTKHPNYVSNQRVQASLAIKHMTQQLFFEEKTNT